jgi:putative transcriptional regulator
VDDGLDKATMRDFDARHVAMPNGIEPAQIKQLREANNLSQPIFARYLNTSESTRSFKRADRRLESGH